LADGVALALAQGAEVIALSEITDAASAHAALHAAEAGACVLATIAASSSAAAIERVLELLGEPLRARTSALLAEHLRLVTHQILLPQAIGHGRVPALELVPGTPQLAELITEDTLDRLPELLRTRRATGMVSQEDAVAALASSGVIQTPTPPKAR
jgi:twitching motility protein PilU